jgi:hypothetical protein
MCRSRLAERAALCTLLGGSAEFSSVGAITGPLSAPRAREQVKDTSGERCDG